MRKVGRSKKKVSPSSLPSPSFAPRPTIVLTTICYRAQTEEAGREARRVTQGRGGEDADSGWEDNNIFQSGAKSSSPVRSSPAVPRALREHRPCAQVHIHPATMWKMYA